MSSRNTTDTYVYLDRGQAADYVTQQGLPLAKTTLQKFASVGGGPVFRRFGRRAVYLASDLDAWIARKLSAPRQSTSATA